MGAGKGALAIDHGRKKTGFAATDALRIATRPLFVHRGPGDGAELVERVAELVDDLGAGTLVIGWPTQADGRENERCAEVRRFVERVRGRLPGIAIVLHDERLSTKEAESLLFEAGVRGTEARELRDAWAALVVLRDWIAAGEPTGA